ncbi:RDD family protein [Pedobacter sp. CFBP9032]|uniref:RDD family protein n=1 Tax=Pedobacter sp. CFBP9032 TaxID=3096539 RepID=UPI002A6B658E|nr:RDD family protein [Pedobacter sp. CFBP9032]MDY0903856.1 RDD family protein [Pedobacter sp. CFBP9032]
MDTIKISTAQNIDIEYEIAGLGERIAARCIDLAGFVVLYFLAMIIGVIGLVSFSGASFYVALIGFAILFVFYDLICELFMDGQTFGKKALKIKVISLDGAQPTFGQYIFRWLFRMIDFGFPFGWGVVALVSVVVTKNHQRVGDILAKTTLIKTRPRTQIENVAFSFALPDEYQPVFKEVLHLNDRDIELVYEVLTGYYQTGNPQLIYAMATKIKEHILTTIPAGMNELQFLETVMKDYKQLTSNMG